MAIDRPEFAIRIRPFVPDADTMLLQPAHIGFAAQEPEQFGDNRLGEQLLGGEKREALRKIEAHLMAENGDRARTRAVALFHARFEHTLHQFVILAHPKTPIPALS